MNITEGAKPVVLAISGSLRSPSFTEKMLDLCLEGMGPDIELHKFYPHKMKIGPCISCWSCWNKKQPGRCSQKDDFDQIFAVYQRADYFLIAAPLYYFDFPATVKNVMDRFFTDLEPALIQSIHGDTDHPKRSGRHPKCVLISSCGFPEFKNFDILSPHFRIICQHMEWQWCGELLIPAAGAAHIPKLFDKKYESLRKAGMELITGEISKDTMNSIAAPVISDEDYRRISTLSFEGGVIAKAKMMTIAMKAIHGRNTQNSK